MTSRQERRFIIKITCKTCGNGFGAYPSEVAKYCSRSCYHTGSRKPRLERPDAIQLSDGQWALVSKEDLDYLRQFGWVSIKEGYARRGATPHHRMMHREVVERMIGRSLTAIEEVDHINGDRLDNRRENLRVASRSQNSRNQRKRRLGASGYCGVSRITRGNWCAYITVSRQHIHIGSFEDPAEAAWFRDQWAIALHGDFARLNFDYQ